MKSSIALVALVALSIAGCDEAPTLSPSDGAMERPTPSTPANPALTYQGNASVKGKNYQTVAVMDADGKNQTNLYGTTRPIGTYFEDESWSPGGTSISFVETNASTTAPVAAIRALDVSVNSAGVAVGSNVRTIYNLPTGYGAVGGVQWSSTSAMNKIAFATWNPNTTDRTLWVVPATGGAPIRVWGSDATYIKEDGSVLGHRQGLAFATWSPDDHRLAVVRADSSGTSNQYAVSTIMIFNTTDNGNTWSYTDSIKIQGSQNMSVSALEWSRGTNGINKLAYSNLNYHAYKGQIFYVDPVTGAVPTTQGVLGRCPSWSPDNMTLIYNNRGGTADYLSEITSFSTNVSNVVVNPSYYPPCDPVEAISA